MPGQSQAPLGAALDCLEEGRRLTVAMIDSAQAGDWTEVSRLDDARRPALEALKQHRIDAEQATPVGEALRALVALNGHLVELASRERQARLGELRGARGRTRGSATYQKLASDP